MKRNSDLPAAFRRHGIMMLLLMLSVSAFSQIYYVGTDCAGGAGYSYTNHVMTDRGAFWQKRLQENFSTGAGSRKWEFNADSYYNTWRAPSGTPINIAGHNQVVPPSASTASAYFRISSGGGDGARLLATTNGNYYTFNITESGYANCHMAVLESAFNPKTFVAINNANTTAYAEKQVTVVLNAAPSAGEMVYLRYTVNGFTSSVIIPFTFVGATGTAIIPTQSRSATVNYYAYSSTRSKAAIDADVVTYGQLAHDMSTLELSAGGSYAIPNSPVIVNSTTGTLAGTPTGYATLKLAFDAINPGANNTGAITIAIVGNSVETAAAILNQVTGVTSVNIRPAGDAARQISGNLPTPILDFNGADNVTIDGLNTDGNTLTIINSNNTAAAGTSTIRFLNAASNNLVQNCTVTGSTTSSTDGVICFATGSNINNTITNSIIKPQGTSLPGNAIYSSGTSPGNNNITISNNIIQDYWSTGTGIPSCGVNLSNNNSGWTITGNKFFQTGTRTTNNYAPTHRGIWINSGGGYTITDNIIGYANSSGTGTTVYTFTGTSAQKFIGIDLGVNSTASSVQNNTVAGITLNTTSGATTNEGIFTGILVDAAGAVNIGNIAGNRVGVAGTGPITISSTATSIAVLVNGISAIATTVSNVSNNTVTAITVTSPTASVGYTFNAIALSGSGGAYTLNSNIIGSSTIANAITVGTNNSTTASCIVSGINNSSTGTTTIGGIGVGAGNTVGNLSLLMAAAGTGSITGIRQTGSAISTIVNNAVHSLTANNNAGTVNGILVSAGTTVGIARNKIYDLADGGTNAIINGISCTASTTAINISNNLVGDLRATGLLNSTPPSAVQGINLAVGTAIPVNVYFNTIYLSGTATGTTAFGSAALYTTIAPTVTLRNNILANNTTPKGTGNAVAYQRASNSLGTYGSASNNNLFYAGTPGTNNLLYFEAATSTGDQTLAAFKTRVSARDAVSISLLPTFLDPVSSNPGYLHMSPAASPIESGGAQIAGYQDDFDAAGTRPNGGYPLLGQSNGSGTAPDIGADEYDGGGTFTWNGNTSTAWNVATNWTPNGIPGTSDFVILKNGTSFNLNLTSAVTVYSLTFNGTGNFFTVSSSGAITVASDVSYIGGNGTWDCASTFTISSAALQPVPPFNYGNLSLGTGNRILPNGGTVGICATFTPTSGTTTATGSIVLFNGSGVQTVPVTTYASVTIANSNIAHVTLAGNLTVPTALVVNNGSKLDIGANTLTVTGSTSIINGTLRSNGTITGASTATLSFGSTGLYEHNFAAVQGIIPLATWSATSTCAIIGYTISITVTGTGNWGQPFGNFTWNCANQTATTNLLGLLTTVNGDFNVLSTGTGAANNGLRLSNTNSTLTVAGNLNITSGTVTDAKLDFNTNGGMTATIDLAKNLTITQGTGIARMQVGTGAGVVNFSGTVNQVVTIPGVTNVTNAVSFRVNNANGITIPNGSVLPITSTGTFYRRLGAVTLVGTGSINYTSTSVLAYDPAGTTALTTTDAEWPVGTEPRNVLINSTSSNVVTLHSSRTVSGTNALVINSGVLRLGNNTLTVINNATTAISRTGGFIETSGTGTLTWYISGTPGTYVFPVGNGTAYTPAQYVFASNTVGNRPLAVRSVGAVHPNMGTPASYINNRYWVTSLGDVSGSYSYTPSYTFILSPTDLVGTLTNIRLSRWNTLVWANIIASSASGAVITTSSPLTETTGNLNNAQWAGRTTIPPAIYTWNITASGLWTTAGNWSPNGIPTSGDVVQFLHAGNYTVSNTPTDIVLAAMVVSGGGQTTLTTPVTGNLGIGGGTAPQLSVAAGSRLTIGGSTVIAVNLPTGNTGNVQGTIVLRDAAHTLTATDASGLTFTNGSKFEAGVVNTNTFSGNPFGSTGTVNTVIFQNGSVFEQFSGSNPFGLTQPNSKVIFQAGSLYKYSDNNLISTPSFTGRTFANFEYNSTLPKIANGGTGFTMTDLTVTQNVFNINMDATCSILGNIVVAAGAALDFAPATGGTINFNSGGNQSISGTGSLTINNLATVNVAAFTNVTLQKDITITGSGKLFNYGVLYLTGETIASGTGTLTNTATGLLGIASQYGINTTTGPTSGNVQTATRSFQAAGTYIYNSAVTSQVTGNALPPTVTGALTISNTATAPDNVVTLSRNNTVVSRFNLNNGQFNAGTGGTLIMAGGGIISGAGGNQLLSGASTDNIIRFAGDGAIQGTPELYNITTGASGAGVDFTNNARVNGILLINSGGFISPNAPKYASGSILFYNTGGSYNRNVEWGSATPGAPSYPHHVMIRNGTSLSFTNTTTFNVGCAGNLTIGNPTGAGSGALDLSDMAANDLLVGGNLLLGGSTAAGTLTLSNTIGGDLHLSGDWRRSTNGVINFGLGNGRAVYFEGATDASIVAAGGQAFPYVYVNKSTLATKLTLADNVTITDEIGFNRGTTDLATNNKFLTILSTATKTARVGPSVAANTAFVYGSGALGQFIIQRHVPARRSWRLLSAPLKASGGTHTISEAWQERGSPLTGLDYSTPASTTASQLADTITNNYGTMITGGPAALGFDRSPNNSPSIKFYNGPVWSGPGNLNATSINAKEGWMLFLRGDRKTYGQITNQYKAPNVTTLRPRGQILIGAKPLTSTGLTVVGNPYASAVDYFTATKTGTGLSGTPTYYMYDPYLGGDFGTGAFVALTWNGTNFTRSAPLTGTGTSAIDNRYIPSGAAIMVNFGAGGTLTFNESDKSAASTTTSFRTTGQLQTGLFIEEDGHKHAVDGVVNMFGDNFNAGVDAEDILKMTNFTENFSIEKNGTALVIERRPTVTSKDTIFYSLRQMKLRSYHFAFIMDEIGAPANTTAFLVDNFTKTRTRISLHDTTWASFTITTDTGSYKPNRFMLVFAAVAEFTNVNAYPEKGNVVVKWQVKDEWNIDQYIIERSQDSHSFTAIGTVQSKHITTGVSAYDGLDVKPETGDYYYRIKATSNNGDTAYSETVKVKVMNTGTNMYVFPNPVKGNDIVLQLNDLLKGVYRWKLMNNLGQVIDQNQFRYPGGEVSQKIVQPSPLVNGIYQLEVTDPNKKIVLLKVLVNR